MLQLRCTQAVQRAFGLSAGDLSAIQEADSLLGNWYVNLFTVDRHKCFLFMNERTLLSFIVYGIKKSNVKRMPEVFINGLERLLALEGIGAPAMNRLFADYHLITFTKTDSKKLLGNMNDLVSHYTHAILYDGGFDACSLTEIISKMNRMPQRNIGWKYSIEVTREFLQPEVQQRGVN
jgi:uncharacterized protein DUF6933